MHITGKQRMNVISLGDYKETKELQRCEETYIRYLKTLGNSQLEVEVNVLLEEFSGDVYGRDFFSKGRLILNEISLRAQEPVRTKILNISRDTLRLI
jgi:hypothetical protein